jgi:hypothetical protein
MDKDVTKILHEKNKDIFKNSLLLEMEKNLDTLKHTTGNAVALEINNLYNHIKQYFDEIKMKYDEIALKENTDNEISIVNQLINEEIGTKQQELEKYFEAELKKPVIEIDYIEKYHKHIDEITENVSEIIEEAIRKEICKTFTQNILKDYKFKNKEQRERLKINIDGIFVERLVKRIKEEIRFRDESLKNMCNESYNKYLNLNKIAS